MESIRTRLEDQTWLNEKVLGGGVTFTESSKTCVFVETSEGPYGYAGDFQIEGDRILIKINAAIAPELRNATFNRKIEFITENRILFTGEDHHTGRYFEITFVREA